MALFKRQSSSKGTRQWAIALDIGTEFVKVLVFEVQGDRGIVKGVGRARQKLSDMAGGGVTDIEGVIKNTEQALIQASEQAKVLPKQVIMGIAGELVKGTTTRIRYIRPDGKLKITSKELADVIARIQRRAFDRARAQLSWESGYQELDIRLVNAAVTDVKIDGQRITNPVGFQGKEMLIGVYNAFAPIVQYGALQTVAEDLDLELLAIAAEPYAVAHALTEEEATNYSAIFMDIGGGTTDIAVVANGGIVGTKMFAFGGRSFTKRIASTLGLPFAQAEEVKLAYSRGELSDDRAPLVRKALVADCEVWLAGVELTLGEFANLELLPSRILLCGGGSNLPEITQVLKEAQWSNKLPFAKRPGVTHIDPKEITTMIDETKTLSSAADVTPLSLGSLAIGLAGQTGVVDNLLHSVVGAMRK